MTNEIFRALGSKTRLKMLKSLVANEMHITGLAKKLGISVPVAARHASILEKAGLIERRRFGKTHVLRCRLTKVYDMLDELAGSHDISVQKGANILDALRAVSGIELARVGSREFVMAIDGDEGFYIYEVNGKPPSTTAEKFSIERDCTIEWKKLVPVSRKKIRVSVKPED